MSTTSATLSSVSENCGRTARALVSNSRTDANPLATATRTAVLDPEVVARGGGLTDAADLWLDETRRRLPELTVAAGHRDLPPVVAATHGSEAAALGAALLASGA